MVPTRWYPEIGARTRIHPQRARQMMKTHRVLVVQVGVAQRPCMDSSTAESKVLRKGDRSTGAFRSERHTPRRSVRTDDTEAGKRGHKEGLPCISPCSRPNSRQNPPSLRSEDGCRVSCTPVATWFLDVWTTSSVG